MTKRFAYVLVIAIGFGSCGRGDGSSLTAGVSYSPKAEALAEQAWTARGQQKKEGRGRPALPAPDTVYRFGPDSVLVKTYQVEDRFSSRWGRTVKQITRYHLLGDTLVYYNGAPVKGVIRQLTDSLLVIDYPGYTAMLVNTGT